MGDVAEVTCVGAGVAAVVLLNDAAPRTTDAFLHPPSPTRFPIGMPGQDPIAAQKSASPIQNANGFRGMITIATA